MVSIEMYYLNTLLYSLSPLSVILFCSVPLFAVSKPYSPNSNKISVLPVSLSHLIILLSLNSEASRSPYVLGHEETMQHW